ncbi:N-6 DNA methylase [Clostridium faecium]|uniref:site-specific DNA-methyltransferase (adenine-specific) n=1 Tax=Clostridium faecium TaxID=2762223 RepID=A0ABR8YV20_9CLOT|nr:N-6 DNA methylase [Clostridium faecium]MBD8048126.1 N-6 DNA methylase [Clostridium faecium]
MDTRVSESVTENIFRDFYGVNTFIEKSAINNIYKFKSKKGTNYKGYPDFFKETDDYVIIVEAKALKQSEAEEEVQIYMLNNNIKKDIIGIAISGQNLNQIKATYYYKLAGETDIELFQVKDKLITLSNLDKTFKKKKHGETVSNDELITTLKNLNERFHADNKVRNTDRSLFFSGLMIALTNANFRNIYNQIEAPSKEAVAAFQGSVLESHNLNESIVNAINEQLQSKVNNLSKVFNWKDQFSFIKNIDYSLKEYKEIINIIHNKIYIPFSNEEKQDILGKAYKVFLSRSGRAEDKNIILTPDHIKGLMVKLARLSIDDVVIDTCTGSGGFLMEAMEMMTTLAKDDTEKIEHIQEHQLIGFEIDAVLFALACSNMFLHGDGRSNLLYRSSLLYSDKNGKLLNSKDIDLFNYIRGLKPNKCIINPPYENSNPIDFTLQAIQYLETNGKLIIIMPTPTLTKHKDDKTKTLLEKARLDFVIKMPLTIFSEQKRTVNTSIFGFTKTPHNINDEVIFYNLKDDGYESIQHKGRVDKNNLWNDIENALINTINNSYEVKGVCKKKRIFKKELNEKGEEVLILNPTGFEKHLKKNTSLIKMKDIFFFDKDTLKKDKLQSSKNDDSGEYDFITASDEWKKHTEYTHDCEALIYAVSASGSLGKSQYVHGKFIPSDLVLVLTNRNNPLYPINMKFYNIYLNSIREQIFDDLADGTSKLTLKEDDLKEYYIEYIPLELQDSFVNEHYYVIDKLKNQLQNAEKNMINDMAKIIK